MINIVFYGNASGARYWRFADPAKYLQSTGEFTIRMPEEDMTIGDLVWADIIITQGVINKQMIATFYAAQQEIGKKWIVEFDDWVVVEKSSPHRLEHQVNNAAEIIPIQMRVCDLITTTTPYIAEKFKKFNKNVTVLPNLLDPERWNVPILENHEDTIKIGWVGSMTHYDDFKECDWAIKKLLEEYPNLEFSWNGDPRLADYFEGCPRVSYSSWPSMSSGLTNYTSKFSSMRWDIGIAPLRDTAFNRCKSNIKPLEFGALKIPCVASNVEPYKHFGGRVLIASTKEEWYNQLKTLIDSKEYRKKLGKEMYDYVWDEFNLAKNIGVFIDTYKKLL